GLPILARPRAKGIDPQTFRCDGDLALFPRVRAGDATIPFAALTKTAVRLLNPRDAGRTGGRRRGSTSPPHSGRLSIPRPNSAGFEYQYADDAESRDCCSASKAAMV